MSRFGKIPSGKRLEKIKNSPNYKNGEFNNIHHTPMFADDANFFVVLKEFIFNKDKRNIPLTALPSKKEDLFKLDIKKDFLVWFGHSSYFIQADGKRMLVDPVFSGNASPVKFTTKSFKGSDAYTSEDIPFIDYLFITHDHWDHLDYLTLLGLKPKIGKIITGLGVGAHLEYWGFDKSIIHEKDWNEELVLDEGFTVHTAPARHFSGRLLKRNRTLWMSFVVFTPTKKFYFGGDSGYDNHFAEIGKQFGPFDLAILEDGQYNERWKYIHMLPEETVQAATDLRAKTFLPVHWSKFALSLHAWDEPIKRVVAEASRKQVSVLHPLIGEAVDLNTPQPNKEWWNGIT